MVPVPGVHVTRAEVRDVGVTVTLEGAVAVQSGTQSYWVNVYLEQIVSSGVQSRHILLGFAGVGHEYHGPQTLGVMTVVWQQAP